MVDVAIVGVTGYTGFELVNLLLRNPAVRITAATSRDEANPKLEEIHRSLAGRIELRTEAFDPSRIASVAECVFLALPHRASMAAAAPLLELGVRVIDLSADYRLRNPSTYAQWYGESHADTKNLEHAVYGLPELYREEIKKARLIATPGCYPTSAILALAPLLDGGVIDPGSIIIDSKSGVSGAGRTPSMTTLFPECNESVSAYNIGKHRHTPEIEQILSDVAEQGVSVLFTPHLMPMDRGILSTSYATLERAMEADALRETYREFYSGERFIRIRESAPSTKQVCHTNFCDIAVHVVRGRAVVVSAIDNLVKGASGAAVQCFNLMYGLEETAGLLH